MERISIIKSFFELVGLTKTERISLIKALMYGWDLTVADIAIPAFSPAGIANGFDMDPESVSKPETADSVIISFSEEDIAPTESLQEAIPAEIPTESVSPDKCRRRQKENKDEDITASTEAKPAAKRGRRKKAGADDENSASAVASPKKRRGRRKKTEDESISASTEAKPAAKRGRRKKAGADDEASAVASPPASAVKEPAKRRGRRKAKSFFTDSEKTDAEKEPSENGDISLENEGILPENISAGDKELIEDTTEIADLRTLFEDDLPVRSKTSKKQNPAFRRLSDCPALKELAIGRSYPFEFLYQWDGNNLLSSYVLSDLMPIGIYIPYAKVIYGKYHGFIISIYDEQVIENVTEALDEAKKKQPIDDEEWSVMNAIQFSVVKSSSEILNRMLTKIGGDRIRQNYRLLSPKSSYATGIGKFRYAIDVK